MQIHFGDAVLHKALDSRVAITVMTRLADAFQWRSKEAAGIAIERLETMGVSAHCRDSIHQKYAVIDDQLVWYGSINLLSFGSSQESIMRLASGSVARALRTD